MPEKVRTTIEIPEPVYRKLEQQATRQGCTVRDLVARGINQVLIRPRPSRRRRVEFPLIRSKGPKVNLTNRQIYGLIEFP